MANPTGQQTMAKSSSVAIASDQTPVSVTPESTSATGGGVPAKASYIGGNLAGNLTGFQMTNSLADGTNNSTTASASVKNFPLLFNGTTWDRPRGNWNTTTGDVPTITTATTTNGATQTNYNARGAIITAILGTVTGTSPTLSLQLQYSPDGGTTWLNFGAATAAITIATGNTVAMYICDGIDTVTTLGATGSKVLNSRLPRTWRVAYVTTGSGSLSIPIASCQINYLL